MSEKIKDSGAKKKPVMSAKTAKNTQNTKSAKTVRPAKKKSSDHTVKKVVIGISAIGAVCIALILLTAFGVIRIPALRAEPVKIGMAAEGDVLATSYVTPGEEDRPEFLDPAGMSDEEIMSKVDELLEKVDADAYFAGIGTVVNKIAASSSQTVTDEDETRKWMEERGFGEYAITTEYEMDGSYHSTQEIGTGSTRHPVYQLVYCDSRERQWMVFVTNGTVHASLVSYSVDNPEAPPLMVAEADTLTGYDNLSNTFFEYQPKADAADVRRVPLIDAATLDAFNR